MQLQVLTFSDGNTTLLLKVDIQTESLALPSHCPICWNGTLPTDVVIFQVSFEVGDF